MQSIKLRSHIGSDGILQVQLPLEVRDIDLEVMVIFQPLPIITASATEAAEWPSGFFEQTFGSIPELERPPQGDPQVRQALE